VKNGIKEKHKRRQYTDVTKQNMTDDKLEKQLVSIHIGNPVDLVNFSNLW
jgi:hypothetical protein